VENGFQHFPPFDRKENSQKTPVSSMTYPQRNHPRQIRLGSEMAPKSPAKQHPVFRKTMRAGTIPPHSFPTKTQFCADRKISQSF
jgi:hypothetical protein